MPNTATQSADAIDAALLEASSDEGPMDETTATTMRSIAKHAAINMAAPPSIAYSDRLMLYTTV